MRTSLLALLLCACATQPQVVTKLVTQKVEVPVPVRATPPKEALECRGAIPDPPKLRDVPGGILIPDDQISALVGYVSGWARCDSIWRAWATAPSQ
ncbi:MAG: hypothetical protein IRY96_00445 [Burkholderiales bacterium]|nr:hypothetical protein [Burkholderiales bacterium]